ncbi:MAG: hypothetical protein PHR83_05160 [Paludibacter sp.]|nr:hypothetical protein [Paludibacter sp.]
MKKIILLASLAISTLTLQAQMVESAGDGKITGKLYIAPSGATPDLQYNGSLMITKPSTSGQYINLVRQGLMPWSIGTVYSSNTFAIGQGTINDAAFSNPYFNITNAGNVGIGTTTPNTKIESVSGVNAYPVTSGVTQSGAALRLRGGDNAVLDFGMNSINTWIQATDQSNLAQKYNISLNPNGGNVGIGTGTSAPGAKLDVAGDIILGIDGSYNLLSGRAAGGAIQFGTNSGTWDRNLNLGFIDNTRAFSSVISLIHQTGYVGIGTTSPQAKLDVVGNARISSDLEVDGSLIVKSIDAQNSYGSFHVGGVSSNYYPVRFMVCGVGYVSSMGKLSLYRNNVHEDGNGFGSFNSEIEFIPTNWGHIASKLVSLTYIPGYGTPYGDPIGDIQDGSTESGASELVIWLKGGATYHWSTTQNSRVSMIDPNTDGVAKTSSSNKTLNPITSQAQLVTDSKNNRYLKDVGLRCSSLNINNNLAIGTSATTPTDELLTVFGVIHAKEVKVDLTGTLADYVFSPSYKLMPLNQVEQYVNANSHLPEIPSASEVKEKGMNMGDMQNKLLQKVEELTLYVIELNKKNEQQSTEINQLKERLKK